MVYLELKSKLEKPADYLVFLHTFHSVTANSSKYPYSQVPNETTRWEKFTWLDGT